MSGFVLAKKGRGYIHATVVGRRRPSLEAPPRRSFDAMLLSAVCDDGG